jgi:hypothetical protein
VSLNRALFAGLLHLPFPFSIRYPWLGASLPAFAVAYLAMLAMDPPTARAGRGGG